MMTGSIQHAAIVKPILFMLYILLNDNTSSFSIGDTTFIFVGSLEDRKILQQFHDTCQFFVLTLQYVISVIVKLQVYKIPWRFGLVGATKPVLGRCWVLFCSLSKHLLYP